MPVSGRLVSSSTSSARSLRGCGCAAGTRPDRQGRRSVSATQCAADAEEVHVPAHNEHGIRGSHRGIVTRLGAVCPQRRSRVGRPAFTHDRVTAHVRGRIPGPWPGPDGNQDFRAVRQPRWRTARSAAFPLTSLALADPAKRGIGRALAGQVLAVAPGAARALVMSALAAGGADHVLILAPLVRARQSRAAGRGDARAG